MNLETDLQSNRGRIIFAAAWAGLLAACWSGVQASAPFQALVNHGKQLNWGLALLYTVALSLAVLTLILWAGLAVYLATIRQFRLLTLARGLAVMLFVLFVAMGVESFVRVGHLSRIAEFVLRWFPMFASLFAGCRLAVPRKPGELFSRAAAKL